MRIVAPPHCTELRNGTSCYRRKSRRKWEILQVCTPIQWRIWEISCTVLLYTRVVFFSGPSQWNSTVICHACSQLTKWIDAIWRNSTRGYPEVFIRPEVQGHSKSERSHDGCGAVRRYVICAEEVNHLGSQFTRQCFKLQLHWHPMEISNNLVHGRVSGIISSNE